MFSESASHRAQSDRPIKLSGDGCTNGDVVQLLALDKGWSAKSSSSAGRVGGIGGI